MSVPPACLQGPVRGSSSSGRGGKPQHGLLVVFSERPGRKACLQAGTSVWNSTLVAGDTPGLSHRDEAGGIVKRSQSFLVVGTSKKIDCTL